MHTIKDEDTNKLFKSDILLLFITPLIISILLIYSNVLIVKDIANTLLTILSISVPLLFSLLIFLSDISQDNFDKNIKNKVINQTFNNVAFLIFLSILIVLIIGFYVLIEQNFQIHEMINYIYLIKCFSLIIYYCLGVFLLTLLMILKKTHILIDSNFPQQ